jgi:hypothetical protein
VHRGLPGDQAAAGRACRRAGACPRGAHVDLTQDEVATSWGLEFLQAAQTIDCDLDGQAGRRAAFKHLERTHPSEGTTSVVLRHKDGSRFVRTSWFRDYVRGQQDHTVSPEQLRMRMQRVGWLVRGQSGRIKATSPGPTAQTLAWNFYVAPAGWGDA